MPNLLKRNEFDGIDRVCYHGRDMNASWGCAGCEHHARCKHDVYERLAQFEEIGMEPEDLKTIAESFRHIIKKIADNFSRCVVEVCPHCDSENEIVWDVETMGYKAYCPVCGKQMMLCDECIHSEDGLNENSSGCDWHEDEEGNSVCFRCKRKDEQR